jgi:hypothetical protein
MTPHELALILDNRQYREEMTKEEEAMAKENGLVVMFGYSDDNAEFRGAIHDEVGAWVDETFGVDKKGRILTMPDKLSIEITDGEIGQTYTVLHEAYQQYFATHAKEIEVSRPDGWRFETEIPHSKFSVMEDEEFYWEGIVFALADIAA